MKMLLPLDLLKWIDDRRGLRSRQAFIISILATLKNDSIHYNTEELINEVQQETIRKKG